MAKTSAHVKPITNGSEAHNRREKELSYIDKTLSHLNEKWEGDSVKNRLESIRSNYTKTTGQRMQDKATPIRECVVVIDKTTTMNDLKVFSESLQERFGIKTFQIHTHRDEGHMKAKEWKPNLHAHLVFDWTDSQGKTLKLKRQDMAEMQTILSKSLKMERGESSEVKHLNAIQYKVKMQEEQLKTLTPEVESKKLILERFNELKPVLGTWEKDIFKNVKIQPLIASFDKFKEQHEKEKEELKAELSEKLKEHEKNAYERGQAVAEDYLKKEINHYKEIANKAVESTNTKVKETAQTVLNVVNKALVPHKLKFDSIPEGNNVKIVLKEVKEEKKEIPQIKRDKGLSMS